MCERGGRQGCGGGRDRLLLTVYVRVCIIPYINSRTVFSPSFPVHPLVVLMMTINGSRAAVTAVASPLPGGFNYVIILSLLSLLQ